MDTLLTSTLDRLRAYYKVHSIALEYNKGITEYVPDNG